MIEILFRGKDAFDGEWVEGNYCKAELLDGSGYEHFIIEVGRNGSTHKIVSETTGQYTGLRDMNMQMAWEGDVTEDRDGKRWVIFRAPGGFGICRTHEFPAGTAIQFYNELSGLQNIGWFMKNHEIIGNIHDNPELLRRKECKAKSKDSY